MLSLGKYYFLRRKKAVNWAVWKYRVQRISSWRETQMRCETTAGSKDDLEVQMPRLLEDSVVKDPRAMGWRNSID